MCVTWLIDTCDMKRGNELCMTRVCGMTHWCMCHGSWQWVMYDMCVWHDSLMYVSWLVAMSYVWHVCVTWLIDVCVLVRGNELWVIMPRGNELWQRMYHSVWHVCVTWLIDVCYDNGCITLHSWHGEAKDVVAVCHIQLIHVCDMTHCCVHRDSWLV